MQFLDSLNISSYFVPVDLHDVLEVKITAGKSNKRSISYSGIKFPNQENDLILKAYDLLDNDFDLLATDGTAAFLNNRGISCRRVNKVMEGQPHIVDLIKNGQISLIINTTEGKRSKADSYSIRATAISKKVPYTTTVAGASAALMALTAAPRSPPRPSRRRRRRGGALLGRGRRDEREVLRLRRVCLAVRVVLACDLFLTHHDRSSFCVLHFLSPGRIGPPASCDKIRLM